MKRKYLFSIARIIVILSFAVGSYYEYVIYNGKQYLVHTPERMIGVLLRGKEVYVNNYEYWMLKGSGYIFSITLLISVFAYIYSKKS